jgi:hypothetical protein
MRTFLELGAYGEAAGSVRGHARNVLAEWGLGDFTDAVVLVASELIANAVTAAIPASAPAAECEPAGIHEATASGLAEADVSQGTSGNGPHPAPARHPKARPAANPVIPE